VIQRIRFPTQKTKLSMSHIAVASAVSMQFIKKVKCVSRYGALEIVSGA